MSEPTPEDVKNAERFARAFHVPCVNDTVPQIARELARVREEASDAVLDLIQIRVEALGVEARRVVRYDAHLSGRLREAANLLYEVGKLTRREPRKRKAP